MISVSSGHLLIRDGEIRRTFNPEDLRAALLEACRDTGFEEEWLADHLVLAVEEHLAHCRHQGAPLPTRADIDTLVVKILVDAGYADVGARYSQNRTALPQLQDETRDTWTPVRVQTVLQETLPLTPEQLAVAADHTVQALRSLGFGAVGDELIRQLAVHGLMQNARPDETEPGDADTMWLLTADDLARRTDPETAAFLQSRAVTVFPVSHVLPAARIRLHLDRLGNECGAPPLTELLFIPAYRHACRRCGDLLRQIFEFIGNEAGTPPTTPRGRLFLSHCTELLALWCPMTPTGQIALLRELEAIAVEETGTGAGHDILVTREA